MTDTPLDLDAIEARAEAATDGPWLASHNVTEDTHDVSVLYSNGIGVLVADFHKRPDDARFAAHARTDVPALVAALRKAEAQVAAVLALCDQADARLGQGNSLTPTAVRAAVDGAS